jgi:UDP-N-acetylmuramoyl-tripeptide--D-alanyl-D-alanine ligase
MSDLAVVVAGTIAAATAGVRWLRVAQREHYLAGSATRFGRRWWGSGVANIGLGVLAAGSALAALVLPAMGFVAAGIVVAAPLGLPLRGRAPGPLAWTRRLRTLAAVLVGLYAASVAAGWALGAAGPVALAAGLALPALTDVALAITQPLERRLAQRWVDRAAARLGQVAPTVVGITGSYGKTSTKNYVAHLAGANRAVVASPRSFNNAAGLAIAVNENLVPGTEVFVAEMGTYGPGEIAAMRAWLRPSIAVITAIGPVHLERFRSEDRIVAAKSEILVDADVAVLNTDDERLARVAGALEGEGRRVVRCSAKDAEADVCARPENGGLVVYTRGRELTRADGVDAHPGNVACAVAVALALGAPAESVGELVATLPGVPNRLTVGAGSTGATVVDDTFNSNPAGAAAALDVARRHATVDGKLVVVTPGMVELGPRQQAENAAFAQAVAATATHLLIVGGTNLTALRAGARGGHASVVTVASRADAVAWVKETVGPGDVVLFENDLPDHYP